MARVTAFVAALLLAACSLAQVPTATFELGFGGHFVTERWNPLRLTLRDVRAVELELRIDQGSLRAGERLLTYRVHVRGGTGISVFEDELFVPGWRRFTWTVSRDGSTLASGAFDPKEKTLQPLDLLLSGQPGRYRGTFEPEARTLELAAGDLPERAAAYDGVCGPC